MIFFRENWSSQFKLKSVVNFIANRKIVLRLFYNAPCMYILRNEMSNFKLPKNEMLNLKMSNFKLPKTEICHNVNSKMSTIDLSNFTMLTNEMSTTAKC